MSITASVNELDHLTAEIKILKTRMSTLRRRSKVVNNDIQTFLKEKQQPGVKYNGKAYILETKEKIIYKKKDLAEQDALNVLIESGCDNPEETLNKIMMARRGESIATSKLKVKKIKK